MAGAKDIIVLGLDPGSRCTGYGVVVEESGVARLLAAGTIRTNPDSDVSTRLGVIFTRVAELIADHEPNEAAIEDVFTAKNSASALKLGQARGAAMAACATRNVPVSGYPPAKVKQTIAGSGRAEKKQVAFMVGQILGEKPVWASDAGDALAIAICHLNMRRYNRLTGK